MSPKKDNDLTDITQLPDFDEHEDDESFSSLDDLARNIGLETEETPPDFPEPPAFHELPDIDSENDFSKEVNFSDDIEESDFSKEVNFPDDLEETDFSDNRTDFDFSDDEETDFSDDSQEHNDLDFSDNDSPFESDESPFENDINDEELNFSNTMDFSDENEENDDNDQDNSRSFETSNSFETVNETTQPLDQNRPRAWREIEQNLTANQKPEFDSSEKLTIAPDEELPSAMESKTRTPIRAVEKTHQTPPEEFEEFKNFAKTMTYSNFASEGNPPFSIILKNLSYYEDVEDIVSILDELKIISPEDRESTIAMLSRGQLLIPRLSEYAAIYLCHRLRRFDVEILMGLTEEISPPKSYESNDRGLSSKRTIYANRKHHYNFKLKSPVSEILVTTLPQINEFRIVKYLGVVTENQTLSLNSLAQAKLEDEIIEQLDATKRDDLHLGRIKRENMLASSSQNKFNYTDFYSSDAPETKTHSMDHIYQDLLDKIKLKAKSHQANGIVGINFAITPVSAEEYIKVGPQYQILCSGNMVWMERT